MSKINGNEAVTPHFEVADVDGNTTNRQAFRQRFISELYARVPQAIRAKIPVTMRSLVKRLVIS
jgi:hypothetical protein